MDQGEKCLLLTETAAPCNLRRGHGGRCVSYEEHLRGPMTDPQETISRQAEEIERLRNDLGRECRRTERAEAERDLYKPFYEAIRDCGLPDAWQEEDIRIGYVEPQIDKSDWRRCQEALAALAGKEPHA